MTSTSSVTAEAACEHGFPDEPYVVSDGVYSLPGGVQHSDEAFDPAMFPVLHRMQDRHFWYRGRHRFVWHATRHWLERYGSGESRMRCIDIGGACGGWIRYILDRMKPAEIAVGDSCRQSLELAATVLPACVARFHLDIANLQWTERWNVVFLLDVVEHIVNDRAALCEVHRAVVPGGLVFVTVPALQFFWSWYDEFDGHQRRYSRRSLKAVATSAGFEVLDTRYFNCLLSPLVLGARRLAKARSTGLSPADRARLYRECHRTPWPPINGFLSAIFAAETPLGHVIPFPWGTSCLAVLRKPVAT